MRFILPFLLVFALAVPAYGAAPESDHRYVTALRMLSVNRSLRTKAEAEYNALQKREAEDATGHTSKRLSDLRYKIQALNEDARRLQLALPPDLKADALLSEVVQRKKTLGDARSSMDVEADKRLAEQADAIWRLHEKALRLVAERRFELASNVYEEIVLLNPDDDEAYLLLGHTCLASGRYEKAATAFRGAMHIDPQNLREIPRLYENILVENPSDDEAMTQLGYAHLLLGGTEEARLAFEDALEINPANIEAKRGLLELRA